MAGDTFLDRVAGIQTQKRAIQASAGAGDQGKIPGLDATGRLDQSMMPVGVAADTKDIQASEAISDGDFVNVWDNAGAVRVRKADASAAGKEAHGFVLASILNGAIGTVYFEGRNTHVAGATAGPVYLSATVPGGFSATSPGAPTAGKVAQRIGVVVAATEINFEPEDPTTLA